MPPPMCREGGWGAIGPLAVAGEDTLSRGLWVFVPVARGVVGATAGRSTDACGNSCGGVGGRVTCSPVFSSRSLGMSMLA